jgi:hypothetical protein
MQVKDISDEQIYKAIRLRKKENEDAWEKRVPGYKTLTTMERIKIAAMALTDPKAPNSKLVPDYFPGVSEKLIYRKMEKMVDQGKLEYGTSIRSAWIVGEE